MSAFDRLHLDIHAVVMALLACPLAVSLPDRLLPYPWKVIVPIAVVGVYVFSRYFEKWRMGNKFPLRYLISNMLMVVVLCGVCLCIEKLAGVN